MIRRFVANRDNAGQRLCSCRPPIRIAVGLSGGVDSSVAALLTRNLIKSHKDVLSLRDPMLSSTKGEDIAATRCSSGGEELISTLSHYEDDEIPSSRSKGLRSLVKNRGKAGLSLPPWSAEDAISILKESIDSCGTEEKSTPSHQQLLAGYFMRNWRNQDHFRPHREVEEESSSSSLYCAPSEADFEDAAFIARHPAVALDDFRTVDFSTDYYHRVFSPMLEAFFSGKTVNPDVYCNSEVKFKSLLLHSRRFLRQQKKKDDDDDSPSFVCEYDSSYPLLPPEGRCDFLVTGHYARTLSATCATHHLCCGEHKLSECVLLATPAMPDGKALKLALKQRGRDSDVADNECSPKGSAVSAIPAVTVGLNDQTHYLSRLCPYTQLPYSLFPIGALLKSKADVREVATFFFGDRIGKRTTSTGLCFVAEHLKSGTKMKENKDDKKPKASNRVGQLSVTGQTNGQQQQQTLISSSPATNPKKRRSVASESVFRDLLAREYLSRLDTVPPLPAQVSSERDVCSTFLLKNVAFFLAPPNCTRHDLKEFAAQYPTANRRNERATENGEHQSPTQEHQRSISRQSQRLTAPSSPTPTTDMFVPIPYGSLVVSDQTCCFPFDFPNGKKVIVKDLHPAKGGGGSALKKFYVCGRVLSEEGVTEEESMTHDALMAQRSTTSTSAASPSEKSSESASNAQVTCHDKSSYLRRHLEIVFLSESPNHPSLLYDSFVVESGERIHWLVPKEKIDSMFKQSSKSGSEDGEALKWDQEERRRQRLAAVVGIVLENRGDQCLEAKSIANNELRQWIEAFVSCRHHDELSECVFNTETGEVILRSVVHANTQRNVAAACQYTMASDKQSSSQKKAPYTTRTRQKYNITSGQTAVFYKRLSTDYGADHKKSDSSTTHQNVIAIAASTIL